jgi:hypothetical protein
MATNSANFIYINSNLKKMVEIGEDQRRVLFTELYEYSIYMTWVIGIFLGIHIEQIQKYSPPGISEVAPQMLITSHSHLLLMTLLLYFLNRMFRATLSTRKWPYYWTELSLVLALLGAITYSITHYLEAAIEYGGQLQMLWILERVSYGNIELSSTAYVLSIMGFLILAIIARILR